MKILHLANHCHEIGNGIMNVAVDLACEQAKAGHDVAFGSAGGSFTKLLRRYDVTHYDVPQHWRDIKGVVLCPTRLQKIFRRFQPDIVHAHMMSGALVAFALRPIHRYALITTIHNEWQRSARLMGLADRVVAVSAAVARSMIKRGIAESRIRTVLNGTLGSPRSSASCASQSVQINRPSIMTVCGLYQRKGVDDLILAFQNLTASSVYLYVVGEGPDRARFEELARRTECRDRIIFTGFQPEAQELLKAADIFVLASRNEPFGLVLAEARQAGCAIVATEVGGIPEVLEHGRAGILVPSNDPGRLTKELEALLSRPSDLNHWKQRAQMNLAWLSTTRMAEETLAVYEDALRPRIYASELLATRLR